MELHVQDNRRAHRQGTPSGIIRKSENESNITRSHRQGTAEDHSIGACQQHTCPAYWPAPQWPCTTLRWHGDIDTGGTGGTGVQGYKGTGVQGVQGVQEYRGTGVKGHMGTGVHGVQGYRGIGVQGYTGTWVQGVHGYRGYRGYTGTGAQGYKSTGVQETLVTGGTHPSTHLNSGRGPGARAVPVGASCAVGSLASHGCL